MELFQKQYLICDKKPDYDGNKVRCIELKNGSFLCLGKDVPFATNADSSAVIAGFAWDVVNETKTPYRTIEEIENAENIDPEHYFWLDENWCGRYIMVLGDYLFMDATGLYGAFYSGNIISSSFPLLSKTMGYKVRYANIVHKVSPDWFPPSSEVE